jgi:hypothetical protein
LRLEPNFVEEVGVNLRTDNSRDLLVLGGVCNRLFPRPDIGSRNQESNPSNRVRFRCAGPTPTRRRLVPANPTAATTSFISNKSNQTPHNPSLDCYPALPTTINLSSNGRRIPSQECRGPPWYDYNKIEGKSIIGIKNRSNSMMQ